MHSGNQGLALQLQTSNLELSSLQIEVSHLRTSLERKQPTEYRDAENLRNLMAKIVSWVGKIFGNRPRLNGSF